MKLGKVNINIHINSVFTKKFYKRMLKK